MRAQVKIHQCRNIEHPFPVIAWLIMLFQGMLPWKRKSYSHMAISYDNNFYDCRFSGCRKSTTKEFRKTYEIIDTHTLPLLITPTDMEKFFLPYDGRAYDNLQLIGQLLKYLRIVKTNRIGHDLDKMVCNELVIVHLAEFYGLKFIDSDDFGLVDTWNLVKEY